MISKYADQKKSWSAPKTQSTGIFNEFALYIKNYMRCGFSSFIFSQWEIIKPHLCYVLLWPACELTIMFPLIAKTQQVSGSSQIFSLPLPPTCLSNNTVQIQSIFKLWPLGKCHIPPLRVDFHDDLSLCDLCALVFYRKIRWQSIGCDDEGY